MARDQTTPDKAVSGGEVRVWDVAVRLAHWLLVAGFVVAYLTEGEEDVQLIHVWAGYSVLAIVFWRIVWGLVGPHHARFVNFVRGPVAIWQYLRGLMTPHGKRYLGHNPAGGAMVVLLLVSLMVTTMSGLGLYAVEENSGPLASWLGTPARAATDSSSTSAQSRAARKQRHQQAERLEDLLEETHEFMANFSLFLVLLHVAGVAASSFAHRENLPRSMITGVKRQ